MKRIKLNGAVFSGQSEGKKFLELPWVKRQIEEKLGFTPYPGTLNIRLLPESAPRRKQLETAPSIKVCPAEGYCNGLIYPASIGDLRCAIVVPDVANYPSNILEVIAPENLIEKLHLKDGDETAVTINL